MIISLSEYLWLLDSGIAMEGRQDKSLHEIQVQVVMAADESADTDDCD